MHAYLAKTTEMPSSSLRITEWYTLMLERPQRYSFALLSFPDVIGCSYFLLGSETFSRVHTISLAPHDETRTISNRQEL